MQQARAKAQQAKHQQQRRQRRQQQQRHRQGAAAAARRRRKQQAPQARQRQAWQQRYTGARLELHSTSGLGVRPWRISAMQWATTRSQYCSVSGTMRSSTCAHRRAQAGT